MLLFTYRYVLSLLAMATFLNICQVRSLTDESPGVPGTDDSMWQPKEGTRSEWMACRGMPKDVCKRTKTKKQELQKILAKKFGLEHMINGSSPDDSGRDQCIMFTEEQLDMLIAEAKKEVKSTSTHRSKRTLTNFKKEPYSMWSMPIPYMFDGTHDYEQRKTIRRAFQRWTDSTCIRFRELSMNAPFDGNYILLTNQDDGCWSYVGRIANKPQPLNLESWCIEVFGTVLHEIGHSLGLFHEQERIDRNDSIRILESNIKMAALPQYMHEDTDAHGLPYNYGSVMHYPSKGGFSKNGGNTMHALQPLYQMNMGQRADLSFHDRKIINVAYCKGVCKAPLSQPCQRGGYQNPNKCSACICPDGFSGQYCSEVARPQNANCGGVVNIVSRTREVTIKSPGYDDKGYSVNQECTWWIKAPKDYTLELAFIGNFGIFCRSSACFHWVEIKYKKDLGLEGARFCCDSRPTDVLISESNEMMVIFRSNYSVDPQRNNRQRGFQALVKSTPNGKRKSLFRCSFEKTYTGNSLCGMTQDTADQFDWTLYSDPTPSDSTGPDFPYDGNFYIYIEASSPRKPNDEARLFFPRLNFVGEVCVNFFYHMFGSSVKTLQLVRINQIFRTTVTVWSKTGQSEDRWLQASVGVYLSSCSQLHFVGTRGNGYEGDIGLDNIEVKSGPCSF